MLSKTTDVQTVPAGPIVTASPKLEGELTREFDLLARFERDAELAGLIGEKANAISFSEDPPNLA